MTIGIEAERANRPVKTGVEYYAKELIQHLARIDTKNKYILYLQTQPEDWFLKLPENFQVKVMPFPIFWTQLRISFEMLVDPPDVLFVPASTLPLIHPRSVYTEHDVAWIHYPEVFNWYMLLFHQVFSWLARKSATKIIAISHSTKKDLVDDYEVDPEKVVVVQHGYEESHTTHHELSAKVTEQLPEKYVLFLSTLQPRKNLELLIDAFKDLKKEHPELPHKLVVVGKPGWKYESIIRKINANKDVVTYLGHIADSDRWSVYNKAELFIYPSLYEGFGMPILEAFECGVPVAVANNSSLPEVGGDAVLYFNPTSKDEMKNAMLKIIKDPALRLDLIAKGKARLPQFGWAKCAQETLNVLEDARQ